MRDDASVVRFVRGLVSGAVGRRSGDVFVQPDGRRVAVAELETLGAAGAVAVTRIECRANAETSAWLRRRLLGADAFGSQHRVLVQSRDGATKNAAESPLTRLAHASPGEPAFLERHHLETGERVRRLAERAQLGPRLTMTYSAAHTAGGTRNGAGEVSDLAADARKALGDIHRLLPRDCASVVLDVCGLFKGLQEVERERGWPRRSAKLVLRIGLDRLAEHYGISPFAQGAPQGRARSWTSADGRPSRFE